MTPLFLGIAFIILGNTISWFLITPWQRRRCREWITGWAAEQGYELVNIQLRNDWNTPWAALVKIYSDQVYRVTIRTAAGECRDAWVLCGATMFGLFKKQITVDWMAWN